MDKELFEILLIPFGILGICVMGLVVSTVISRKKKKLRSVRAEVLSKRIGRSRPTRRADAAVSGSCRHEYYVTFLIEGKKKKELQVKGETYSLISEGDKGSLTFEDYNFVSFTK